MILLQMVKLYLLLGGNLGDKLNNFKEASGQLIKSVGSVISQSAIYETEPWGFESSDLFWNQVLELNVSISPLEVLAHTQQIEQMMGRKRSEQQYGSRIMDIDLLFYGEAVIQSENLVIPHPRIQDRKFVLIPLNEIAPELIHPVYQKSISQLLAECTDMLKVEKVEGIIN